MIPTSIRSIWQYPVLIIMLALAACTEKPKSDDAIAETSDPEEEVFMIVEDLPEYPGGMDAFYSYIKKNITYPQFARQNGIEGKVYVQLVVERDGSLSELLVAKGIGGGCDEEAARVIKSAGSFSPAKQRGKSIRVGMIIPIEFKLDKEKKNPDGSLQGLIIVEKAELIERQLKVDANYSNGVWTGTVYDENEEALPGANILVRGTTSGTVSDLDGTFKLKAEKGHEIVVSFVGYETVRIMEE